MKHVLMTLLVMLGFSVQASAAALVAGISVEVKDQLGANVVDKATGEYRDPKLRWVIQLTCQAHSPRIFWGRMQTYYVSPMVKYGRFEAVNGLSIGGGDWDKGSITLTSEWSDLAGAVVQPILESASCYDLDTKEEDKKLEIRGPILELPAVIHLQGFVDPESGEVFKPERRLQDLVITETKGNVVNTVAYPDAAVARDHYTLPANRFLNPYFLVNAHPAGDEFYELEFTDGITDMRHIGHDHPMYLWKSSITTPGDANTGLFIPTDVGFITPDAPNADQYHLRFDLTNWIDQPDADRQRSSEIDEVLALSYGPVAIPLILLNEANNALVRAISDATSPYKTDPNCCLVPRPAISADVYDIQLGDHDLDAIPADSPYSLLAGALPGQVGQWYESEKSTALRVKQIGYDRPNTNAWFLRAKLEIKNTGNAPYLFFPDQLKCSYQDSNGLERNRLYNIPLLIVNDMVGKPLGFAPVTVPPGETLQLSLRFLVRLAWWNDQQALPKSLFVQFEGLDTLAFDTSQLSIPEPPPPPK